jgi:environmental stress-induced protein Ves
MQLLRAAQHRRMRWKNGLGETVEIAVAPEGASLDDFDWRVSMAHVGSDGPFSLFAGIDRTLCVLEGEGIVLQVAGRPEVALNCASEPFAFPGDVAIASRLVGRPIIDLNVMTRRGALHHRVRRLAIEGTLKLRAEADLTLLLSRSDGLVIAAGSRREALDIDDAGIFDEPAELTLGSRIAATAFAVEFSRAE